MIVAVPDPVLRESCALVRVDDGQVRDVVEELRRAVAWTADQGRPAAGLAAPQVGRPVRVFVIAGFAHAFVNPRVLRVAEELEVREEGCLSVPGVRVRVERPRWVKLRTSDEYGDSHTYKLHGIDARAALHELDHLDGILITDRVAA